MRQPIVPERNGPDILPDIADDTDKVVAFLTEELHHGRRYTGRSLEAMAAVALKMTRIRLRAALAALEAAGRLEERELPAGERHGARRYYLHPAYCAAIAPRPSAPWDDLLQRLAHRMRMTPEALARGELRRIDLPALARVATDIESGLDATDRAELGQLVQQIIDRVVGKP